jgi:alkanesulfonate monooxygenase SsuD/methylene tetrahydromethanopterin reductase-like flavin-dependent oxidoreductase (luciferase family)
MSVSAKPGETVLTVMPRPPSSLASAVGTSVLDIPYYSPVMLARRVTTLDVLSGGRVRLGLGLGWSKDEHDAVGAPMKQRGARAEEFLAVMKAIWTTDPAEFKGQFFTLPRSVIETQPVQKPHPPIYMAAFVPVALKRIARLADGWTRWGSRWSGCRRCSTG